MPNGTDLAFSVAHPSNYTVSPASGVLNVSGSPVTRSVAFVPFAKGKPTGPARDFMTGWMLSEDNPEVWGRPVAVMEMTDGSLLVSDDGGKKIWRISYKGK